VQGQAWQRDATFPRSGSVQVLPPSSSCTRIQSAVLPVGVGGISPDGRRASAMDPFLQFQSESRSTAAPTNINVTAATPGMVASPPARGLSHTALGGCGPMSRAASRGDSSTPLATRSAVASPGKASPARSELRSPRHFSVERQVFCAAAPPPRPTQEPPYLQSLASPPHFSPQPHLAIPVPIGTPQVAVGAASSCSSRAGHVGRVSSPGRASPTRSPQGIDSMQRPLFVPNALPLHANASRRMSIGSFSLTQQAPAWQPSRGVFASLDLRNVTRSPALLSLSREARMASSMVNALDERH